MNNKAWDPFRKKCISKIAYKIESHLTDIMEPGDIVLHRAMGYQVLGGSHR